MKPQDPTDPQGVMIGDIEARLIDSQPSAKRGDPMTLEVYIQFISDGETQSQRYSDLKDYQKFAGEASYQTGLGGTPHLQEHPQDYWDVDSHVVPVTTGDQIYEFPDFWGLIDGVDDSNTSIVGEPADEVVDGYGGSYGDNYGGDLIARRSPNHYRLGIDIVPLGDIDEYADREEVFADLSPVLNQM